MVMGRDVVVVVVVVEVEVDRGPVLFGLHVTNQTVVVCFPQVLQERCRYNMYPKRAQTPVAG